MKVVILAGGLGTRLSEETGTRPKPMVEIGGKPILWHIMKFYSSYGYNDFIICAGYKNEVIKNYFMNYFTASNDFTINLKTGEYKVHGFSEDAWNVTIANTGLHTQTAGRLGRIKHYFENDEDFLLTYGDGLADINLKKCIQSHFTSKKAVTVTAVRPSGRFGELSLSKDNEVLEFQEKVEGSKGWINGGFFVCKTSLLHKIHNDNDILEQDILPKIANQGDLNAYKHNGFWQPMDTLREKKMLNDMWKDGNAKWKIW
jgi:glucose-1-phosphate cytidylyltransferase